MKASERKSVITPVVPVVMCAWQRASGLPRTIECLARQQGVAPELYVWNNNPAAATQIDAAAVATSIPVRVRHSPDNVGGFGRFYYARELAERHPFVVFIDDDQLFDEHALATLWREARPRTITSWWAYNFLSPRSYWLRMAAPRGGRATYVGTCGMVADSSIFTQDGLFECPKEYWFIEDLWLSYWAEQVLGWQLYRSRARFWFLPDSKNQFMGLVKQKTKFLRYLHQQGWQVSGRRELRT